MASINLNDNHIYRIAAVERKVGWKHIDVFVCADDGNVYTAWWDEGYPWSTTEHSWRNLGGQDFPPRAAVTALSRMPLQLDIFVCGNDHHIYTKWWNKRHGWASNWQDLGGVGNHGNMFAPGTEIAAVARLPDKIDLFASATNGNVYKCYWCGDHCCGGWSSLVARCGGKWTNIGGRYHRKTAAANVAVLSRNPSSFDVFFCGGDGLVRHKAWGKRSSGGWDEHWEILGGDKLAPGGYITATARRPDHIDLFSCGIDGCVYTSWWRKGEGWSGVPEGGWRSLGGGNFPPGAPVSAVAVDQDHLDICILDNSGSLRRTWWDRRIGLWQDWTDLGGRSVPGSPTASLSLSSSSIDVFVTRSNGEILTMSSKLSSKEALWSGWGVLGTLQCAKTVPPSTTASSNPGNHTSKNILEQAPTIEEGKLMSVEDQNTLKLRSNTDMWFTQFQKLLVSTKTDIAHSRSLKPLKVAILDSGIDKYRRQFSKTDQDRIKEVISFVDDEPFIDGTGHGTHIAAIILRLTGNAVLYIGKVTKSDKGIRQEDVAKALRHARTSWQVDLISISFGFHDAGDLHDEIDMCLNAGIMVFASASNDAGEGSRTYPAKFSRVACIYSANSYGNASHYNPPLEEGENFCVVGEQIRPTWLVKAPKDCIVKYENGTSFATPVAVSIAAFMIAFIEKKWPDCSWIIKPRSSEGIMKILKLMSVKINGYDWVSPTRYLREINEDKIFGDLKQTLGCRPVIRGGE